MATGHYDADGFWHYGEDDLADEGAGFSSVLNKSTEAIPAGVRSRVVAELASDSTIRQAAAAAVTDDIQERNIAEADDARFNTWGEQSGWIDPAGRASIYDTPTGSIVIPRPLISPGVGIPMEAEWDDGTVWDPATGRVREGSTKGGFVPTETLAAWGARAGWNGGAQPSRLYPALVTGSAGNTIKETRAAVHARGLVSVFPVAYETRVHVRNFADRDGNVYGNVNLAGIYLGRPARAGGVATSSFAGAPVQVLGATVVSGAAETVGPWVPLDRGGLYMASYEFTATGDTHAGIGTGWTSAAVGEASQVNPATAMASAKTLPLDIWFEVRVPAWVRIGAAVTDSHGLASNSESPVQDAFVLKAFEEAGIALMPFSNHGSTLAMWTDTSQWKYQKYAGLTRPDFAVICAGSNDIMSNGADLATTKNRFGQVVDAVRAVLCDQVYATTLFARRADKTSAATDAVRRAYNTWLLTLPNGIRNAFDISTVLEDPATANPVQLRAENASDDNVHLNREGHRLSTSPLAAAF